MVNLLCSAPILCDDPSYFQIKFGHLGMWGYTTLVFDHHCHHNLGNPGVVSSVAAIMWQAILHELSYGVLSMNSAILHWNNFLEESLVVE